MPLFFLISGLLHVESRFSLAAVKKLFISLMVPFFIYNILYLPMYIVYPEELLSIKQMIWLAVTCRINSPTWFLFALFGVKLLSLWFKNIKMLLLLSLICVVLLWFFNNVYSSLLLFRVKAILAAFPFFAIGYLIRKYNLIDLFSNWKLKFLVIVVTSLFLYWFTYKYGRVNTGTGLYQNLLWYYLAGILGSISTILVSQIISVKSNTVKTLSRGTMMIVGTHWVISVIFKYNFPDVDFVYLVIISVLITILYYFPIKVTYNRMPILFGKMRNSVN